MSDAAARFDLSGRIALVTGGSRGLGRVIAEAFARAGADVIIASRKTEHCRKVAAEIADRTGRRTLGLGCHVGRWGEVEELARRCIEDFGSVDVLVNNAGMSPVYDSVADVSEMLWDKVLSVNLKGPFRLAAVLGSQMAERGGGSIINISSIAAERPTADVVPYAAAKAGLNAMTIGLAHAFGPTVRVNAIMAGPFLTDVSEAWDAEVKATGFQSHALGRAGDPEEIAGAALYFASDASSFTSAAVLKVDGGRP